MQTLKRLLRFFEHLLVTWTYISITVVEKKTKFTKIMLLFCIDENLKSQWREGVGWNCNKAYSNGRQ
jgi:hypothetical protein